ncbi:MAG: hypothetical protein WBG46_08560 [Nonlabens sp.]
MKKQIILGAFAIFALIACQPDEEGVIFNNDSSRASDQLVSFESSAYDLAVIDSGGGEVIDVVLEVSTLSDVDRTYSVEINEDESTALDTYFVVNESTITIPAGSYEGVLEVIGNDLPDLPIFPSTIVFDLLNTENLLTTNERTTVSVFKICPLPDTFFTGTYNLFSLGNFFGDPNFQDGTYNMVVTSSTRRTLQGVPTLPGNTGDVVDIPINFICGNASLARTIETGFTDLIYIPRDFTSYDETFSDDSQISIPMVANPNNAFSLPTSNTAEIFLLKE